jgi:pSer/pThr/pTyr-binding forkhead associated (FHA) protein
MLVGRRRGCHITLTDGRVSAHHCQLKLEPDGHWYVRDLGSTNGTFVNGQRINLKQLELGDELRIGTVCRFRVESGR